MRNVAKYLNNFNLSTMASVSNIRYGTAIFKRKGVSIIRKSVSEIVTWVGGLAGNSLEGGGTKRRVHFWIENDQLFWRCTGNPKDHEIFCKHCVAAALYLKENSKK